MWNIKGRNRNEMHAFLVGVTYRAVIKSVNHSEQASKLENFTN